MTNEDDEALRARVARLEEALQAKQHETESADALRRRVAELERQVADKGPPDPRAALVHAIAERRVRVPPGVPMRPPRLLDRGAVAALVLIPSLSALFCGAFLPMLGAGALLESAACPPGFQRSYTSHYRRIENGNASDHWEFRCVTADGQDVPGKEGTLYLAFGGFGLALGLAVATVLVISRRSRRR